MAEDPCPWINGPILIHHGWVATKKKKKIGCHKTSVFYYYYCFFWKGLAYLMERVFWKEVIAEATEYPHVQVMLTFMSKIVLIKNLPWRHFM